MISVFTPSHDPKYLDVAYDSLLRQTNIDWEWVVLLNQDAQWNAPSDHRVKVISSITGSTNVGALKSEALTFCTGEFLVELDHDDMLTDNALWEIENAFLMDDEISMVYSDWAHMKEDGTLSEDEPWPTSAGWLYYTGLVNGQKCTVVRAQAPTPINLSRIWWAPNHVRAFRRTSYDAVDGYADMPILDDQDLMSRLYLHGPFEHIPVPLYVQREHSKQTQRDLEINARIQHFTQVLGDQYLPMLVAVWRQRHEAISPVEGAADPTKV